MQASKNDKSRGLNELYEVYLFFVPKLRDKHKKKHLKGKINLSLQAGPRLTSPYSCRDFLFRGGRDGSQASPLRAGWHSVSSYVIVAISSFTLDPALPCLSPLPAPRSICEAALLLLRSKEGFASPVWGMHSFRSFLVSAQTTELWKCFFTFGWSMGGRDLVLRVAYDKGLTGKVLLDTK